MARRKATIVLPGEGSTVDVLGLRLTFKATGQETSGAYAFLEGVAAPGVGTPMHVHHREDEAFYILDGTFEIVCGGDRVVVGAGSFALLPKDIPHGFRNVGDRPSKLLGVSTPAGIETFFRHLSALSGKGPLDPVELQSIGESFGIELLDRPS